MSPPSSSALQAGRFPKVGSGLSCLYWAHAVITIMMTEVEEIDTIVVGMCFRDVENSEY